jgi:hypothetical protein
MPRLPAGDPGGSAASAAQPLLNLLLGEYLEHRRLFCFYHAPLRRLQVAGHLVERVSQQSKLIAFKDLNVVAQIPVLTLNSMGYNHK